MMSQNSIPQDQAAGYFWKLLELNVFPIITWNFDGEITNANEAFLNMIGYSREEFDSYEAIYRDRKFCEKWEYLKRDVPVS